MRPEVLAAATREVLKGRSVIPVGVKGKHTKMPHFGALIQSGHFAEEDGRKRGTWLPFQEQQATLDDLWTWFVTCGAHGLAIVTGRVSRIVVLDFDGESGANVLKHLRLQPHVRTPSSGYHVWFEHPGWKVPTLNSKVHDKLEQYKGMDIRADGGLAVMPPTVTEKGEYQQLRDLTPDPLSILPDELRDVLGLLYEPKRVTSTAAAPRVQRSYRSRGRVSAQVLVVRALEIAGSRGRNEGGFHLSCALRDQGYSQSEALEVLAYYASYLPATNAKGQKEPYTAQQYAASVRSAYRRSTR